MLVQLNNGKILSLDAVSTLDIKDTKIVYNLNNGAVLTEAFETEEEVRERLKELFDFNLKMDEMEFDRALDTAERIQGE